MIKFNKTQHGMTNRKKKTKRKEKNKKNQWSLKKAMGYIYIKKKPST